MTRHTAGKLLLLPLSLLIASLAVSAEDTQCEITTLDVATSRTVTINTEPAQADVEVTISSADDLPVSGPTGVYIDLVGIYQLDCQAWKDAVPRSSEEEVNIFWILPHIAAD